MRKVVTILLFFAAAAHAEERYIVPVYAINLNGLDRHYHSSVTLSNLHTSPARALVQAVGAPECVFNELVLSPRETQSVHPRDSAPIGPCIGNAFALEIIADKPVVVRSHVRSRHPTNFATTLQEIPVTREWLAAGREMLIPSFQQDLPLRANVVLVNPNQHPIDVTMVIERLAVGMTQTSERVQPRSVRLFRVPEVPTQVLCIVFPCLPEHRASLVSTGPFYAGVSTIFPEGDAIFYPAIPAPTE